MDLNAGNAAQGESSERGGGARGGAGRDCGSGVLLRVRAGAGEGEQGAWQGEEWGRRGGTVRRGRRSG